MPVSKAGFLAFLLAFSVCIAVTYVVRPLVGIDRPLGGLGYDGYLELARNIAHGNGYVFQPGGHKVFHRPPLYPILLLPAMVLPSTLWRFYVACLNSFLFALAAGMLLQYARKLLSLRVAAVAWLSFVLNPVLLVACKNATPGIAQVFGYILILCLSYEFLYRTMKARVSSAFILGYAASLAFASMTHGTMLTHAFVILGIFFIYGIFKGLREVIVSVILIALLLAAMVAPWAWRNYKVTRMFMPVAGNAGLAYFAGNAHWGITKAAALPGEDRHQAEARHMDLPPENASYYIDFYGLTDPEIEKAVNARAKAHIASHPFDFIRKVFFNSLEYYGPVIYFIFPPKGTELAQIPLLQRVLHQPGLSALCMSVFNLGYVVLAIFGARRLFLERSSRFLCYCLLAAWIAFALPYFPFLTFFMGRSYYTLGTFPIMSILSAPALVHFFRNRTKPAQKDFLSSHSTPLNLSSTQLK
jgi:hypothetical protein